MWDNYLVTNLRSFRDDSLKDYLIIEVKYSENWVKFYAIKKNENNQLEWKEIEINHFWKPTIICELNESDFENFDKQKIIEYYNRVIETELYQKLELILNLLYQLYSNIYKYEVSDNSQFLENKIELELKTWENFNSNKIMIKNYKENKEKEFTINEVINLIRDLLNSMNENEQYEVAIEFSENVISQSFIENNQNYKETEAFNDVYKIYLLFQNSLFWKKFWNLINL